MKQKIMSKYKNLGFKTFTLCSVVMLFIVSCGKMDTHKNEIEDTPLQQNDGRNGQRYQKEMRIAMDQLDQEYIKLDSVVRKNYETKQAVLFLLTKKRGNILYAKKASSSSDTALAPEGENANSILEEFNNIDLRDEEDKPINFFDLDSIKQKQFLKVWIINNGKNLEDKIKLEPTVRDVLIQENKAFEECLQEAKGIAINTRVEESKRDINFILLTERMQEKMAKHEAGEHPSKRENNAGARTQGNDYLPFCNSLGDGLYWAIEPYYSQGRFLIRLRESELWWLNCKSPGHTAIIIKGYSTFFRPDYKVFYLADDENERNKNTAFTIGAYPHDNVYGTVDGVQYEPIKVWSKPFYVCAPATSRYRFRWRSGFEVMRWELDKHQKHMAIMRAHTHLGQPYGGFGSKNSTDKFYCSKLIYQVYKSANYKCNLSVWYERWPSPNSIFRDEDCIVLSHELTWGASNGR